MGNYGFDKKSEMNDVYLCRKMEEHPITEFQSSFPEIKKNFSK
jgi:hypothetical protein